MSLNLFVDFFGYSGGIEVLAHIVNGFLILVVSLAVLRQKVARLPFLATLFVAAAIVAGFVYILNTYDIPSYSMAMAMSFIIAYTVFFYELKG
jgi:riboflavin transporter FmnP